MYLNYTTSLNLIHRFATDSNDKHRDMGNVQNSDSRELRWSGAYLRDQY